MLNEAFSHGETFIRDTFGEGNFVDTCRVSGHNPRVTFSDYVRVLRRFLWLVLAAAILGGAIAYALLILPDTQYQAKFTATLAPHTNDPATYGQLIDALDRRSIPSTFAQIIMSPSVKDAAASNGNVSRRDLSIKAVVVTDSNVIQGTITGPDADRTRAYGDALLKASTSRFTELYPLYTVTPLRFPTGTAVVPRHELTGVLLGALAGAVLAFLLGLAVDAGRRPTEHGRIRPAPIAGARIADTPGASRPPWKPRPHRTASKP